jgi:hypothetical protein
MEAAMTELIRRRRKAVGLCVFVGAMGSATILLKEHPALLAGWVVLMIVVFVYAIVQLVKLEKKSQ